MLKDLNIYQQNTAQRLEVDMPDTYKRNEQDDLKQAIDYLYDFKNKLNKLHPNVVNIIDNMLQRTRY